MIKLLVRLLKVFSLFVLMVNSAYADDYIAMKRKLEDMIQYEKNLDSIIVTFDDEDILSKEKDIEIKSFEFLTDKKFKVKLQISGFEIESNATYEKASLIIKANKKIPKGKIILGDDLEVIKIPEHKATDNFIQNIEEIVGKYAKKTIIAKRPIKHNAIGGETVMNKGQKIIIRYKKNNIIIEGQAIALENAGMGDTIKFKNIDSGKFLYAKVISPEAAEIKSS